MFENVLVEQNPHWEGSFYAPGVHRTCFETLQKYLDAPHVISVTGVRRAGKSTLLKQLINFLIQKDQVDPKNIVFVNLEHPYFFQYSHDVQYLEKLWEDYLKLTKPQGRIFCFLDEVQFFAQWPIFVKAHYEQGNVKFAITGSNSFLMSHELLTMLSGRTLPVEVYPLSLEELIHAKTKIKKLEPINVTRHRHEIRSLLDDYLCYGGFPNVALNVNKEIAYDILNAYSKTILYQDVASRLSLKKPLGLEKLFYYLTSHVGTLFSYSSLEKIFNLSDKTIKEYIQALIDANLLFELDRFSFSLKQQVRSEKKIYSIDPGLVNAIAFKFSENKGRLFENTLYLTLKRSGAEIYYYKTKQNYEVDFVVKRGNTLSLIQVCLELNQEETAMREIRGLVHAAQELGLNHGEIITADEERELIDDGITIKATPLYKFIL